MNKFILRQVIISAVLLVFLGASTVNAQGFSSILDKLDKLELKIKSLEQRINEGSQSSQDISGLESRLNGIEKQVSSVAANEPDISGLENRLASLEADVSNPETDQDWTFIENSIVELTMQMNQLEKDLVEINPIGNEGTIENQLYESLQELTQELKTTITQMTDVQSHQGTGDDEETDEGSALGQLELFGFFDVLYAFPEDEGEDKGFALGQMEVDIESSISPFISASGAIAYGDGVFEVGAAFVDLHWMGESISHPVRSEFVDHSGILVGQFDVPFGADYQRIASPDRALFTPPLAVEMTIDGWNDLGLNIYGGHEKWEAQGFAVNGDQGNIAYGGRLTAIFSEYLNIGGSYATIIDDNSDPQVNFMGGDLTINYEPFEVIAEYLVKQDSVGSNQWDITGYYVEGKVGLVDWLDKDVYLIGGYSEVQTKGPENSGVDEKLNRITIGAGINIIENASIRIEHLINGGDDITDQNLTIGQFVVSF